MMFAANMILTAQSKSVTITVYNKGRQTADGTIIPWQKVKNNVVRWCAISPNLHKKYGGPYGFGDTITISGAGKFDGEWIIHDLTSKRHRNWIDLLVPPTINHGRWKGTITRHKKSKK